MIAGAAFAPGGRRITAVVAPTALRRYGDDLERAGLF
jgi:hypothetical protein